MRKTSNNLQELRRRIYQKAKSVPTHRFWGLFTHITHITHITHMTTLYEAYHQAKKNGGAPGIDGQSFADVEQAGVREFLESIRAGLQAGTYQPQPILRPTEPIQGWPPDPSRLTVRYTSWQFSFIYCKRFPF